jgi:hypothetical protein
MNQAVNPNPVYNHSYHMTTDVSINRSFNVTRSCNDVEVILSLNLKQNTSVDAENEKTTTCQELGPLNACVGVCVWHIEFIGV